MSLFLLEINTFPICKAYDVLYNFNFLNDKEWNTLSFKWTQFVVEQWWCIYKPHDIHDIMKLNEAILGRKK